jgi:hypothetical protein
MQMMNRELSQFAQTDVVTHQQWAKLTRKQPLASAVLHILVVLSNKQNAVVVSQKVLADHLDCHVRSIVRALKALTEGRWIEVRQIGSTGTVNAYIINSRVSWKAARKSRGLAALTANVVLSGAEQPDRDELGHQPPLRKIDPSMFEATAPIPMVDGQQIGEAEQLDMLDWMSAQATSDLEG